MNLYIMVKTVVSSHSERDPLPVSNRVTDALKLSYCRRVQ